MKKGPFCSLLLPPLMVPLHFFGCHYMNGLHHVVNFLNFWTTHIYQRCYFVLKVLQNRPLGIAKCIIWSRPTHKNSPGIILELSFFLQRAMCVFVVFIPMHLFSLNIVLATLHYRIATLKITTVKHTSKSICAGWKMHQKCKQDIVGKFQHFSNNTYTTYGIELCVFNLRGERCHWPLDRGLALKGEFIR